MINGLSTDLLATQIEDYIHIKVNSSAPLDQSTIFTLKHQILRMLSLDVDTSGLLERAKMVGPEYVNLVLDGAGRLLRAPTLWEDCAKTLFTTNCSWTLTKKICESICSPKFVSSSPSGDYPFPPPKVVSECSISELNRHIPIGYRAKYLTSLAATFAEDPNLGGIESMDFDHLKAKKIVIALEGFGAYASTHVLVLLGYYKEIPIDTVVSTYLKENHRARKPKSFLDRYYRVWGPYKWWGLKLEKMIRNQNRLGD